MVKPMVFGDKEAARKFFHRLTQATKDWNRAAPDSEGYNECLRLVRKLVAEAATNA
jgi:V/A-type H+-transporting ATPase subunit A